MGCVSIYSINVDSKTVIIKELLHRPLNKD